ncbi:MAG: peptidase T, partial [Oscillospiraceae bacterium]|nr:peptidase T [Oscillospiraceae bacterium]
IVHLAENALRLSGFEPVSAPVRGGTDGSQLSFRGLPCPNLGTGGYSFHGPYEHITAERLEKAAEIVINIVRESIK